MNIDHIPLYGHYPPHHDAPSEILAILRQNRHDICHRQELPREKYPLLPWTMDELPGTTWRNIPTYRLTTIQAIHENKFGKLGPDPDPYINAMFSIGLYWDDHFIIDHWVRMDTLTPRTRMDWHILAVIHHGNTVMKAQIALQKQKQKPYNSCRTANINARKRDIEYTREHHTQAITQMTEFATLHDLLTSINIEFTDLPLFANGKVWK